MRTSNFERSSRAWKILALILGYCILTKIWGMGRPFVGNFASYQLMLADIANFYAREDFRNLLYPATFISKNGSPGLLMLNFPVPAMVAALFYKVLGGGIIFWGHFQAILFSCLATLFLYGFIKTRWNAQAALWSVLVFNLSPLTTIYGQSFMYDMPAVCFVLAAFFLLEKYYERNGFCVLAGVSMALAILMRIHFVILLLPLTWLFFEKEGLHFLQRWKYWIWIVISLLMPLVWFGFTYWVVQNRDNVLISLFPQIQLYASISLTENPFRLFITSGFYLKIFYYFARYILTPLGLVLFPFALWDLRNQREKFFLAVWFLALILSVGLFPKKHYDHNFYFLIWLVPISILFGSYLDKFFSWTRGKLSSAIFRFVWLGAAALAVFLNAYLSYRPAFAITIADQKLLSQAKAIAALSETEDRVIVGTALARVELLSLSERVGWPLALDWEKSEKQVWYQFSSYDHLSEAQRKARYLMLSDPVEAIKFYKTKGAKYFFVADAEVLKESPELKQYLEPMPKIEDENSALIRYDLTRER